MKHTMKLTKQDSASFIVTLVIMAGTYIVIMAETWCFENSLSDYVH